MWRVGSRVPIVITTKAADGTTPESDAGAAITIYLAQGGTPLGPYAAPTVSVGKQQYDWDTTGIAPGLHSWTATTTSHGNDASDVIDLQPAIPQGLVSLADARTQLTFSGGTASDVELRTWIDAITGVIENGNGHDWRGTGPIIPRTVVEQTAGTTFLLRKVPVLSVTSIVPYNTTVGGSSYVSADLLVDSVGRVTLASGDLFPSNTYTVTYRAGREVVPPAVSRAALLILEHYWETKRGAMGPPQPGGEDNALPGAGFLIPYQALALLQGYARAPSIG